MRPHALCCWASTGPSIPFPHPIYRQGVLLKVPQNAKLQHVGTAVNFIIKAGQEATLKFATEDELPE